MSRGAERGYLTPFGNYFRRPGFTADQIAVFQLSRLRASTAHRRVASNVSTFRPLSEMHGSQRISQSGWNVFLHVSLPYLKSARSRSVMARSTAAR